jgi:L-lactate dehydrogenase complex protein LldF
MRLLARTFASRSRYERAQKLAQLGQWPLKRGEAIEWLPGALGNWTIMRDLPAVPSQSFREWWQARRTDQEERA